MAFEASRAASELPAVDDRLVAPQTRFEMFDGELVYVSPADPPHGERHLQLAALIEAHTGFDFEAAADLLTRISKVRHRRSPEAFGRGKTRPRFVSRRLELPTQVSSSSDVASLGVLRYCGAGA